MTPVNLLAWPNSDMRLDAAHGDKADIDEAIFNGLRGVPLVPSFGVRDNGILMQGNQLRYNWDYSCVSSHSIGLSPDQVNFINSFNPSFFDGILIQSNAPDLRLIDSPAHYRRFVEFFKSHNPNTVIGSYISSIACAKGATHPHTENYYPPSMVDGYRLASRGPDTMGTPPFLPRCAQNPGAWRINVALPGMTNKFCNQVIKIIRKTTPKPPFVFLDNGTYLQPEFLWLTGEKCIDCRDKSCAGVASCHEYQDALAREIGPNIYFDDVIKHYRKLIAALEKEGVRSILNVTVPPAMLGYPREVPKYAQYLEQAVGTNGMAFEQPFHFNPRTNAQTTAQEIAAHKRLLQQDKLVLFYADYEDIRESSWIAAMAMLIRNPGQSLFIARNPAKPPAWIMWPSQYGSPMAGLIYQQVSGGDPKVVGDHWYAQRSFRNGEIKTGHLGVTKTETFDLTRLAPELIAEPYTLLHPPKLGTWNESAKTYQADSTAGVDYFIFGAQPDTNGFYKKLIAISARIFN